MELKLSFHWCYLEVDRSYLCNFMLKRWRKWLILNNKCLTVKMTCWDIHLFVLLMFEQNTRKMSKYCLILPRVSETEHKVSSVFSTIQAKAIENGFLAHEFRGTRHGYLIIEGEECEVENIGPHKAIRILVDQEGWYKLQVHTATLHQGHVDDGNFDTYLNQMKPTSNFVLFPDIGKTYLELKDSLTRKPTKLREWVGQTRFDNVDCELWHNKTEMPRNLSRLMCQPCQSLITSMKNSKKRVEKKKKNPLKTPPKTMPLQFLTPKTRKRLLPKEGGKHIN